MSNDLPAIPMPSQPEAATSVDRVISTPPPMAPLGPMTPLAPAGIPSESAIGPDWRRVLASVRRYKWMVIGISLTGIVLGFVASRFFPPAYVAKGTIWVDVPDFHTRVQPGPVWTGQLTISTGWTDLLQSDAVILYVVRQERLYLSTVQPQDSVVLSGFDLQSRFRSGQYTLTVGADGKTYTLADADNMIVDRGAVGDSVGRRLGWLWVPPPATLKPKRVVVFTVAPPQLAAAILATQMTIRTDENGNFLVVQLKDPSSTHGAAVVNAIAKRFIVVAGDLKKRKLLELTKILQGQVARANGELDRAEGILRRFRQQNATLLAQTGGATRDQTANVYFQNRVTYDQVRNDRQAIENVLAQVADSGIPTNLLGALPSVQQSALVTGALKELADRQAELRALRYRYTDQSQPVQKQLATVNTLEHQEIPGLLRSLSSELSAREQDLSRQMSNATGEMQSIPAAAIDDERLQRDVASAEQQVANVRQNYEEAQLAAASAIPDVRILDPAVEPKQPTGKWVGPALIVLAFLGFAGVGVAGAVLLDRADTRFRDPQHVTDLGLPILGVVPRVKKGDDGDANPAHVIEAFRSLRLAVQTAYGSAGPLVLTTTSAGSHDGKTFVTANLALAFAAAGQRTLVIDGDVRRGALHRVYAVERKPGLIDHLSGTATRDEVVQQTSYPLINFIACGERTTKSPELLGTPAMSQLLTNMRQRYQVILVDSAPMAACVDPYILGSLTGNLLLVMRTGYTDRELMQTKVDMFDRLPVRLLGAVLNDVEPIGSYRYYAYYTEGYEAIEEAASTERVLRSGD